MDRQTRHLQVLLRIGAVIMLFALVAVIMPRACMVWTHGRLGLGAFPDQPIAEYLARSLSGMYAMLGAFCWIFGTDPPRYRVCIRFTGVFSMVGGLALGFLDWRIGMPHLWMLGETVIPTLYGVALLMLARGLAQE